MNAPSFCSSIAAACSVVAMFRSSVALGRSTDSKLGGADGLHIRGPTWTALAPPLGHTRPMLLGRERERAAVERLLANARTGTSGVAVITGEPGIGKSALLADAAASAEGMRVLSARGVEREAAVPFGGLLELLRPVVACIER